MANKTQSIGTTMNFVLLSPGLYMWSVNETLEGQTKTESEKQDTEREKPSGSAERIHKWEKQVSQKR